jgi:predicted DNA-binding protein YlxM (UPF0122 family)
MIPKRRPLSQDAKNNIGKDRTQSMTNAYKAGTGGITDIHYLNSRQEQGYKFTFFNLPSPIIRDSHLTAQHLIRIKQIMKPSIVELSTLFEVSRQTIYNWLSGEEPTTENVSKIENLLKTANFLADAGLTSSQLLKRKIIGTQSLYDIIQKGDSSFEAAQKLVNIIQNETKQRTLLEERLKGRKPKSKNYDDFGSPMLD